MCFSLFFFKQKTAYDMRISDWSSDVCSSDLADDVARLHMHGNDLAVGMCEQTPVRTDDRCFSRDPCDVVIAERRAIGIEPDQKIGRASCRERVGQYV